MWCVVQKSPSPEAQDEGQGRIRRVPCPAGPALAMGLLWPLCRQPHSDTMAEQEGDREQPRASLFLTQLSAFSPLMNSWPESQANAWRITAFPWRTVLLVPDKHTSALLSLIIY